MSTWLHWERSFKKLEPDFIWALPHVPFPFTDFASYQAKLTHSFCLCIGTWKQQRWDEDGNTAFHSGSREAGDTESPLFHVMMLNTKTERCASRANSIDKRMFQVMVPKPKFWLTLGHSLLFSIFLSKCLIQ